MVILAAHVRAVLRSQASAVLDRAGSAFPLHERGAPRGARASALRRLGRRWLRAADGRDRRRQDHRRALLPGPDPGALRRGLCLQPQAHRDRAVADGLRRVRHPGGDRRFVGEGLRRPAQRPPAALACRRAQQRADHRRGAKPVGRGAGAAAPAHQPGDRRAQAAADRPDRPARAARAARPTRTRAARPARDRALPPARADRDADRAIPAPPTRRRRAAGRTAVRRRGAAPHPCTVQRRAAAHQPARRPRAARRLRRRPPPRRPRHRRARGARGLRHAAAEARTNAGRRGAGRADGRGRARAGLVVLARPRHGPSAGARREPAGRGSVAACACRIAAHAGRRGGVAGGRRPRRRSRLAGAGAALRRHAGRRRALRAGAAPATRLLPRRRRSRPRAPARPARPAHRLRRAEPARTGAADRPDRRHRDAARRRPRTARGAGLAGRACGAAASSPSGARRRAGTSRRGSRPAERSPAGWPTGCRAAPPARRWTRGCMPSRSRTT